MELGRLRHATLIHKIAQQKRNDVLFLKETHSDFNSEADWRRELKG